MLPLLSLCGDSQAGTRAGADSVVHICARRSFVRTILAGDAKYYLIMIFDLKHCQGISMGAVSKGFENLTCRCERSSFNSDLPVNSLNYDVEAGYIIVNT